MPEVRLDGDEPPGVHRHAVRARLRLTAAEALGKTDDPTLREQLLDRAFLARQRLDAPGRAMAVVVARLIALGPRSRGDVRRFAAAQLYRARALMDLSDARPGEVLPLLDLTVRLVAGQPPTSVPPPPYALATDERISAQ